MVSEGVPPFSGEDVFYQGPFETSDVFVYVDRSCSMTDDAANLAANFFNFTDALEDLDSDWQVIVATSDHGCFNEAILSLLVRREGLRLDDVELDAAVDRLGLLVVVGDERAALAVAHPGQA